MREDEPFLSDHIGSVQLLELLLPLGQEMISVGPTEVRIQHDSRIVAFGYDTISEPYANDSVEQYLFAYDRPAALRQLCDFLHADEHSLVKMGGMLATPGGIIDLFFDFDGRMFPTRDDLLRERATRCQAFRALLFSADVVFVMLRATEYNRFDDCVVNVNEQIGQSTETIMPSIAQLMADLVEVRKAFLDKVMIFSISPNPIESTLEPRNVIEVNGLSKATLRVVLDQIRAQEPLTDYFPIWDSSLVISLEKSSIREVEDRLLARFGNVTDQPSNGYMNRLCDDFVFGTEWTESKDR